MVLNSALQQVDSIIEGLVAEVARPPESRSQVVCAKKVEQPLEKSSIYLKESLRGYESDLNLELPEVEFLKKLIQEKPEQIFSHTLHKIYNYENYVYFNFESADGATTSLVTEKEITDSFELGSET